MSKRHNWHGFRFEWRPASRFPDREWVSPGFLLYLGVPGILTAVGLHRLRPRLAWRDRDSWWAELTIYGPRSIRIRRLDAYRQARFHLHVPYRHRRYEDGSTTWRYWMPFCNASVNIGHPEVSLYVGWHWRQPTMCWARCWQYRRAWRKIEGLAQEIDDDF
jgi:hypothetical protein